MTEPTTSSIATASTYVTDPTLVALHLEIGRMRSELDELDARISRIRASEAEAAADARPFGERAQELVDRTVASLYEAGRAELDDLDRQSRVDSEATLAQARLQAAELLANARAELAEALTQQARDHERAEPAEAQLVILPDDYLIVLPQDDRVSLLEDGLGVHEPVSDLAPAPGDQAPAVPEEAHAPEVLDTPPEPEASTDVADSPVADAVEGSVVEAPVVAEVPVVEEPVVDEDEPPAAEPSVAEGHEPPAAELPVAPSPVVGPVEPSASAAAADGPASDDAVVAGTADVGVAQLHSYPPPTATEASALELAAPGNLSGLDQAYDLWLAMAPPEPVVSDEAAGASSRRRWIRAIEALVVVLLVAVLVTVALFVVS